MCGIAFIWDKKNQLSAKPIESMLASLSHRGPDGSNHIVKEFRGTKVYIGHTHVNIFSDK